MARQRAGRRPDYTWFNFGDAEVVETVSNVAQFGSTNFQFAETATISRVRGLVAVELDPIAVAENSIILCGLVVLPSDSIVAGAAPELFTGTADEGSWLWQGALFLTSGLEAAVNLNFLSTQMEIDSKGQRRIKAQYSLAFVYQSPSNLTTDQGGNFRITYYVHGLSAA